MGGGGREGEVRRAEKRWRTTEEGQGRRTGGKKLQNNETNKYTKEKEENMGIIGKYQE